ncbi:META domain-containing protein [uncultured Pseudodesulfovibrio sp.]|uniref:META domain-containing protein n=1 Tax=uncultured Pseudodesulfovibrio sp. TaxID=2035858 RepID=UPI0029C658CE|nr:META domain-containing protein [uncultured Pseudodesulfovibrio sp.]
MFERRTMKALLAMVLCLSLLTACAGKKAVSEDAAMSDADLLAQLAGRAWVAEYIDGLPVVDMSHTSMVFSTDGKVKGTGGCNSYSGGYTLENGRISFTPFATTMRSCVPALNDQEMRFFSFLNGKLIVKFKSGLLYLVSEEGKPSIFSELE